MGLLIMKTLTLGNGMTVKLDDKDYDRISRYGWYAAKCGRIWYALSTGPRPIKMHRFILGLRSGVGCVDHQNRDGLDNRRSNLRLCGRNKNAWNGAKHTDGKSLFKGVTLDRSVRTRNPWRANICVNGVRHRLGRFPTQEDAAKAYDAAAKRLFQEFARPNAA